MDFVKVFYEQGIKYNYCMNFHTFPNLFNKLWYSTCNYFIVPALYIDV